MSILKKEAAVSDLFHVPFLPEEDKFHGKPFPTLHYH